ncbi:MAG: nucleoside recognition domain-containing protein, partial [Pseudomonadota bacterium]|nr:nucleoside recognition domain-containing protein [Pseudomonadota bacterium]
CRPAPISPSPAICMKPHKSMLNYNPAWRQVLQIALIVIPLMVVMQFLEELKVLEKVSRRLEKVVSVIGISGAGALPLLVGLTLGLAYGAGMIIKCGKEGKLTKREMVLIITFLSLNHSLFEDVLLFVAIGAQGTVLQVIRMTVAILITVGLAKMLKTDDHESG